ncbi:hypothetical protein [Billgrantia endophytica]|uniref:Uncharacterized protein n=1 Tax=Billgrantia endophytica TaxID=2033802 RepID=A0A2N7TUA1_9GAMM|nr:hypothetical protein [Halomonas endophytica]PMR71772.1 hypothetical protein C1H69_22835 [Halomonas endophytica]
MLLKIKLSIALALALGVSSTAQAQSMAGDLTDNELRQNAMQVKQNKNRYNVNRMMEGIEAMSQRAGVSKCLDWAKYAPDDHPQHNPYIYKALSDISRYGRLYMVSRGQLHPNDKHMEEKGLEAIDFCNSMIPQLPSQYRVNANPNIAGGRTQGSFGW